MVSAAAVILLHVLTLGSTAMAVQRYRLRVCYTTSTTTTTTPEISCQTMPKVKFSTNSTAVIGWTLYTNDPSYSNSLAETAWGITYSSGFLDNFNENLAAVRLNFFDDGIIEVKKTTWSTGPNTWKGKIYNSAHIKSGTGSVKFSRWSGSTLVTMLAEFTISDRTIIGGYTQRDGDCPGNDISSIHAFVSLKECANRCLYSTSCVAFMMYDDRECYPKTKSCTTTDLGNSWNKFYDLDELTTVRGYRKRNGDCPGNDISWLQGYMTLKKCAQKCTRNSQCKAFMYWNNQYCYPKTQSCTTTDTSNTANKFYDYEPNTDVEEYTKRNGDCSGNDITSIQRNCLPEECARACTKHHNCVAFMMWNKVTCYPKTKSCTTTDTANPLNVFYDYTPSMSIEGFDERNGDCPGNDIVNLQGDVLPEECAQRCRTSTECVAFMLWNKKGCYPKKKTCTTTDTGNSLNVFYDKNADCKTNKRCYKIDEQDLLARIKVGSCNE